MSDPAPWAEQTKRLIRRRYANLAAADSFHPEPRAGLHGTDYPADWFDALPDRVAGAFSGCGWPAAGVELENVRTVVDVGCGGGLDIRYLAERLVGGGLAIGIDLTPEVLVRATEAVGHLTNVRLMAADMEALPLADGTADAVFANAAINLATDKRAALREIHRVLRTDGRLRAADLVLGNPLPAEILADPMAMASSLGGVVEEDDLRALVEQAGFVDIAVSGHRPFGPVVAVDLTATRR